jgi:hypothetical protein
MLNKPKFLAAVCSAMESVRSKKKASRAKDEENYLLVLR